jgi:hypothetical protein
MVRTLPNVFLSILTFFFYTLDNHGHAHDSAGRHGAHGPEINEQGVTHPEKLPNGSDSEIGSSQPIARPVITHSALAQILGVAILEVSALHTLRHYDL